MDEASANVDELEELRRLSDEASHDHSVAISRAVTGLVHWYLEETAVPPRQHRVWTREHLLTVAELLHRTAEARHEAHARWFAAWKAREAAQPAPAKNKRRR